MSLFAFFLLAGFFILLIVLAALHMSRRDRR